MVVTKDKRAAASGSGAVNKGDRTRADILNAAADLFVRLGVAGTTMREIASAAGVKRPTFYYYFQSKDDVLSTLVTESAEAAADELDRAQATGGTPLQRYERCVKALVLWILDHPVRFIVADRNEGSLPPLMAERHANGKRHVLQIFERLLLEGIDKGEVRAIDARVVALSTIGMCAWTAWWFNETGRLSKGDVALSVADTAVAATAAGAGALNVPGVLSAITAVRCELDKLERSANGSN